MRLPGYLQHIIDAIARIQRYVADQVEADFLADERTRDTVVRYVEVIGEAARNVQRHHAGFAFDLDDGAGRSARVAAAGSSAAERFAGRLAVTVSVPRRQAAFQGAP